MTAIVGLVQDGTVYIGGDSAGSDGWRLTVRADSKVFRNGRFLFGFTTSFRMGQLIRYALKPPRLRGAVGDGKLDEFMATIFIDAIRDCLKVGGWAKKEHEREEGGTFLVGVAGRLFTVHDDYQVAQAADSFAAVGGGEDIALGALYATAHTKLSPRRRVKVALQAAERFSPAVRGPFVCLALKR
jgi:ATP-dependent protease HslVU (ClpYQ) peptidase subunit